MHTPKDLEIFMASTEDGVVIGYINEDGQHVPIFQASPDEANQLAESLQRAALRVTTLQNNVCA